jgi:hypothetical protein
MPTAPDRRGPSPLGRGFLLPGEVRVPPAQMILWCVALIAAAVLIYILLSLADAV